MTVPCVIPHCFGAPALFIGPLALGVPTLFLRPLTLRTLFEGRHEKLVVFAFYGCFVCYATLFLWS
jgi:hypothetical protein